MIKRGKTKKDRDHDAIVAELRQRGFTIIDLSALGTVPDILIIKNGLAVLAEIKTEGAQIFIGQLEYMANYRELVCFIKTADDAVKVMESPTKYCLTNAQKNALLGYCLRKRQKSKEKKPRVKVEAFEKEFNLC